MPIERINKVEFNNSTLFLFWPNISKLSNNFFNNIQKNFELKEKIALDNTEITEQLFKAVDTIVNERLRQLPYDKTIIATIVDTQDAAYGRYKVTTDTNITFFAYSDSAEYKLQEKVYIRVPENDYTKQKVITGKYITDSNTISLKNKNNNTNNIDTASEEVEDNDSNTVKNQELVQEQNTNTINIDEEANIKNVGIGSVIKTSSQGNIDTYTIYSNEDTPSQLGEITITNGISIDNFNGNEIIMTANNIYYSDSESYNTNTLGRVVKNLNSSLTSINSSIDNINNSINNTNIQNNTIYFIPSALRAMTEVAETYFNNDYYLFYSSEGYGLFYPEVLNGYNVGNRAGSINNSQFSQALLKGIKFSESRYNRNNQTNHMASWCWASDGTGVYVDANNNDVSIHDYMTIPNLCEYAAQHKFLYSITANQAQVKPGDFIFGFYNAQQSYNNANSMALVLYVNYQHNLALVLKYDDISKKFVITEEFLGLNIEYSYLYGAKFSIIDNIYQIKKIISDTTILQGNNIIINSYDNFSIQPAGFYTIIIEGTVLAGKIKIEYNDQYINPEEFYLFDTDNNKYVLMFYAKEPFNKIILTQNQAENYTINNFVLFKGYYGQDWPI